MTRQVLTVIIGIVFSYVLAAAGGYLLYYLSGTWPHAGPLLARYVLDPIIAVLVGALVGLLAKSRPGLVAVLSLLPCELVPLIRRQMDLAHLLFMVLLALFCFAIGATAASLAFRSRSRSGQTALSRT